MSISTWCTVGICILNIIVEGIKSYQMKRDIKDEMDKYDIKKKEVKES